jgi:hypothetical protein
VPGAELCTGVPVKYRLEPFLPSVATGDRGQIPEAPLPFLLPSGALRVIITDPTGTVREIGPASFVQSWTSSIVDRRGGVFDEGGGHITEPYQLTTLDPRFEVEFEMDGVHRIEMEMTVEDIWGTIWRGDGTFDITVARPLTLDTATLPGTPFETGDTLTLSGSLVPPVAVEIEAVVTVVSKSDRSKMTRTTTRGRANPFGYFRLEPVRLSDAGEYRIDIIATHRDRQRNLWTGARTWGGVVAPRNGTLIAHGARGTDDPFEGERPQWFDRSQLGFPFGHHVNFAFHSGDVQWLQKADSSIPVVTFQDLGGEVGAVMRRRTNATQFDEQMARGEVTPFSSRADGYDPHLDPSKTDLWAYGYSSVQRPLIRVREEISEGAASGGYWRFSDQYAAQPGVGRAGDLPNDFKFQFGGVAIHGSAVGEPHYAIYGSLFVLVPNDDPSGGSRTFPPFQGNGGGPSGGPIMKLKGQEIDLFVHPTSLRAGTILQTGEIASFVGFVAPPLPGTIEVLIISPSGQQRTISGRANKVGYFYDPMQDFVVTEPGIWRARVKVTYDGLTSAGPVQAPYPSGDVLGSRQGEFFFYAVTPESPQLDIAEMPRFVDPKPVTFTALAPHGLTNVEMHYTSSMPGFILEEGTTSTLRYSYNASELQKIFPNIDLADSNGYLASDTIVMSFLLSGTDAGGSRRYFARQIVLQGEEVQMPDQKVPRRRRSARH